MTAPGSRTGVVLSWSGGKDAAWALHLLQQDPHVDVVGLLTTIGEDDRCASMQGVHVEVLEAQARAIGLPLIHIAMPRDADNATYEGAFAQGLGEANERWPHVSRVAFGDLFLADIRAYREAICVRLGWTPLFPLFGYDTAALALTMVAGGLRASVCCVDTSQLPASFCGRAFDADLLAALPPRVDRCGEQGEFHTCVRDGPMFRRPIALVQGETRWRDARFVITDLRLPS